ncbi:hypothetical protein BHM03_00023101 [Ensete ventricosum]|nr:hypothetical protein BHM03_00023101 [Ensete ventricosum]
MRSSDAACALGFNYLVGISVVAQETSPLVSVTSDARGLIYPTRVRHGKETKAESHVHRGGRTHGKRTPSPMFTVDSRRNPHIRRHISHPKEIFFMLPHTHTHNRFYNFLVFGLGQVTAMFLSPLDSIHPFGARIIHLLASPV